MKTYFIMLILFRCGVKEIKRGGMIVEYLCDANQLASGNREKPRWGRKRIVNVISIGETIGEARRGPREFGV